MQRNNTKMFFGALKHFTVTLTFISMLSACSSMYDAPIAAPPQVASHTKSGDLLASLPPAKTKIVASVYEFQDQTGQMKPNDNYADYSRAITQGGLAILNKALLDASHKGWFTVIERGGLKDLLQERQIIKVTRAEYQNPKNPLPNIKPMLYSGIIIEGGIVAYESNIATGGLGAKYLGTGGNTQYRRDIVTVYLRAVSTQTGEILLSVNTSKTIYSTAVDASIFRYVSFDKLLEVETGFTLNEPPQFAVRQAIEMGVYSLIMEGAMDNLWEFKDPNAGKAAIAAYLRRRDGDWSETEPAKAAAAASTTPVATITNPPPTHFNSTVVDPVRADTPVRAADPDPKLVNNVNNGANAPAITVPTQPATKNDAIDSVANVFHSENLPSPAPVPPPPPVTAASPFTSPTSTPPADSSYLPENRYSPAKSVAKDKCELNGDCQ